MGAHVVHTALLSALMLASGARNAEAYVGAVRHPLHTTLTEISVGTGGTVQVSIRVFADDFAAAVARHTRTAGASDYTVADSLAYRYASSAFSLGDRSGKPLALEWCGSKRVGDLVWLCLRSVVPVRLSGLEVHNRMHAELYDDQINIVQALYGGQRQSMLFAKGSGAKRLP